jgi:hypothetical protein
MAQHDYVIANGTGAAVRSDLNNGLSAIVTQNSGATEPATTYAFMRWADTTAGVMKMRNSANNAWITLYQLDGEWTNIAFENGTAAAPSIYFKDSGTDTGFYSPGANQVGISTGGTARLTIDANGNVNIDSNTLYVDAANNRVGVGTSTPGTKLDVVGGAIRTDDIFTLYKNATDAFYIGGGSIITGGASTDIALRSNQNGSILFSTNGSTERMRLDASGRLGIGTAVPGTPLNVQGIIRAQRSDVSIGTGIRSTQIGCENGLGSIDTVGNDGQVIALAFRQSSDGSTYSERGRWDSSGRFLVGTSTASSAGAWAQYAFIKTQGNTSAATGPGVINIARGEAATAITTDENIGAIAFTDQAGNEFAVISSAADADAGSGDYPGRLVFSTTADGASSPTERLRITSAGQVRLAGAGITFNGDTAAANELDDYEEGTFTPTIVGTTDAGTGTYTIQVGIYTKVGTIVHFAATILWTAHTGTGNMRVGGLPFTCENTANYNPACALDNNNLTTPAGTYPTAVVLSNTTQIGLSSVPTGGGSRAALALDTAATIWVSGSYSV